MRIDIAAQTHIGKRKKVNEDAFGVFRDDTPNQSLLNHGAILCVADGLGGHVGGEIASKLAVANIREMLTENPPEPTDDEEEDSFFPLMRKYFRRANDSIHKTNRDLVRVGRPMGTTLLTAIVIPKKVHIGNVGDSRCYHIREGEIINHTEDHSWVDEQVRQGLMTKSEAESDSRKNIVTRCIGTHPVVEMDTYTWHLVSGDLLLLCTDGLVNMVKTAEITKEFKKGGSPADIAHRLVSLANENGGKDNITVIVADINPKPAVLLARRIRAFSRGPGAKYIWFLLALLFGGLFFAAGYAVAVLTR